MLRSFRLSTALAVLAIAVMAGAVLVRVIRRPPPPSVVATVETGPAAATPVAKTGEPEPAAMRTASPDPSAAPSAPAPETNAVAGRETSASATTSATTRPTAGSGVLFQDNRPYQPQDPPAATDRPARPAPESSAPVQVKPAGAPPSLFEDGRNFARPAEAAPPAEVVAAVPARPAAATPSRFEDARGPIIGQQATTAAGEAASAQVASRPIAPPARPAAAIEVPSKRPAAPAPTFSDQRELQPPARPPASPERRETMPRSEPGVVVVERREPATRAPAAPSFVDARDPLLTDGGKPATPAPAARVAAASPAPSTAAVTSAVPSAALSQPACAPAQIASEPLDGGRMLVRIGTPCRADQMIRFGYGDATIVRKLDNAGRLELTLDLFAGTASPIEIVFEDGTSRELAARASDLDKLEKIALIWRAPVDLDLHAFEYGAIFGQPGHVWAGAPASALAAREQTAATRRGRGFLSRADTGQGGNASGGDKIEVYTFLRYPEQPAGVVSIAVDYASRGDVPAGAACGTGAQAEVRFETVVTARGRVTREAGVLSAVPCGTPLAADARFGVLHQIRVNR